MDDKGKNNDGDDHIYRNINDLPKADGFIAVNIVTEPQNDLTPNHNSSATHLQENNNLNLPRANNDENSIRKTRERSKSDTLNGSTNDTQSTQNGFNNRVTTSTSAPFTNISLKDPISNFKTNYLAVPSSASTAIMPASDNAATGVIFSSLVASLNFARTFMTHSIGTIKGNLKNHLRDSSNYEHITRPKAWWEFMLLFSILTGIEFVHAVEAIFVNPLLLAIGIPATFATMIWSVSPILGLVTVPILGSISDKCACKMGRRRPFIIFFSVGIIIGLFLLTFGPNFSVLLGDTDLRSQRDSHHLQEAALIQAGLNNSTRSIPAPTLYPPHTISASNGIGPFSRPSLKNGSSVILYTGDDDIKRDETSYKYLLIFICVGVIIMDYSADSGSSPAMSYMLDITLSVQHTLGLTIGTSMTGTGGLLGYLIGFFDWETIWPSRVLRNQFQIVFMMALILYIITAILTLTSFKEMPLYQLKVDKAEYAQRMSISRPWNYGSNRNINRRYGSIRRGQAQSLCIPQLNTQSATSTLNAPMSQKDAMRYSLPDLRFDNLASFSFNNEILQGIKEKFEGRDTTNKSVKKRGQTNPAFIDSHGNLNVPQLNPQDGSLIPEFKEHTDNGTSLRSSEIPGATIVNGHSSTAIKTKDTSYADSTPSKTLQHTFKSTFLTNIKRKFSPRPYKDQEEGEQQKLSIPSITLTNERGDNMLATIPENENIPHRSPSRGIRRLRPSVSVMTKSKFQDIGLVNAVDLESHRSPTSNISSPKLKSPLSESRKTSFENQISPDLINASQTNARESSVDEDEEEDEEMSLGAYLISIIKMPRIMAILCLTHLLCWMAFLCFATYFSDFVGQSVFHGSPTANPGSPDNLLYEGGVRFACIGMFLYALTCILYSTRIKRFANRIGTKKVYIFGIAFYCCAMAILGFAPFKAAVVILSPAAGIIQASLLSIPFIFVSMYHDYGLFTQVKKEGENKKVVKRGIGTDVAIVSSMVFWAQLIISLTMGKFIDLVNSTKVIPFYGCGLSLLATISAMWITDVAKPNPSSTQLQTP